MENTEITVRNLKNEKITIECSIPSARELQGSITRILHESEHGDSVLEMLNFALFTVLSKAKTTGE